MADTQPTADGGSTEYVLASDSEVNEVVVDDKTLTKSQSAGLTQDQYDRASALEGVKLDEAGKENES